MNEQEEELDLADQSMDKLLSLFLDALRDRDRDAAFKAITELRYKIWAGNSRLPRDVRCDRKYSTQW